MVCNSFKKSKLIRLPFFKVQRQTKINSRSIMDCSCNKWRRTSSDAKICRRQKVHLLRNWFYAADADVTQKSSAELKLCGYFIDSTLRWHFAIASIKTYFYIVSNEKRLGRTFKGSFIIIIQTLTRLELWPLSYHVYIWIKLSLRIFWNNF